MKTCCSIDIILLNWKGNWEVNTIKQKGYEKRYTYNTTVHSAQMQKIEGQKDWKMVRK